MMVFAGPVQGTGKSTWIRIMGGEWSSDSLSTVVGKEAYEQLRGTWIIEMAELTATRRADVESIKHFISKSSDRYREAYGRRVRTFARQCIFIGTTNNPTFLVDTTGNRRFWPIAVGGYDAPSVDEWSTRLEADRDQMWAEALVAYHEGEPLWMTGGLAKAATEAQEAHLGDDGMLGRIQEWLLEPVPADWYERNSKQRRAFLTSSYPYEGETILRDRVCAREVWVECLGGAEERVGRVQSMQIADALRRLGWEERPSVRCGCYGRTRGFMKPHWPSERDSDCSDVPF
jgi:predicted P-loop ATPase